MQVFNVHTLVVKFASCALAVGSGLPVGPEGPMVHIGAMVGGSAVSGALHHPGLRHRPLQALPEPKG